MESVQLLTLYRCSEGRADSIPDILSNQIDVNFSVLASKLREAIYFHGPAALLKQLSNAIQRDDPTPLLSAPAPPDQPFFFCFTLVTGPRSSLSLKLSDASVYEPQTDVMAGDGADSAASVGGCRCKATSKREFKIPWREAGPPNHHDDKADSDQ